MPRLSSSRTTAAESCIDMSENSTPMSGRETRRMMKAKKPMSVSVTAAMAAIRAGPNFVTRSRTGFTGGFAAL
ncbi:hypothetical protein ACRBEV_07595 [Methylobacterium phyllosphaerae]